MYRDDTRNRRTKTRAYLIVIAVLVAVIAFCVVGIIRTALAGDHGSSVAPIATPIKTPPEPQPTADISQTISLSSPNAILIALESSGDRVLFDRDASERIRPASMTKIMTAVVVLENMGSLDDEVTLGPSVFDALKNTGASVAGYSQGETVTVRDLLYGLMLPSGGECAIALTEYISGSERKFANLMNEKAEQLGLEGTHFENSTGLDADDHYSTVEDIATLTRYAIDNETFFEIFSSRTYKTAPTEKHKDGIGLKSTLLHKNQTLDFYGGSLVGGKTGYTEGAGLCLASFAEKDGVDFILVTAGAKGDPTTIQFNVSDAIAVYDAIVVTLPDVASGI